MKLTSKQHRVLIAYLIIFIIMEIICFIVAGRPLRIMTTAIWIVVTAFQVIRVGGSSDS